MTLAAFAGVQFRLLHQDSYSYLLNLVGSAILTVEAYLEAHGASCCSPRLSGRPSRPGACVARARGRPTFRALIGAPTRSDG